MGLDAQKFCKLAFVSLPIIVISPSDLQVQPHIEEDEDEADDDENRI